VLLVQHLGFMAEAFHSQAAPNGRVIPPVWSIRPGEEAAGALDGLLQPQLYTQLLQGTASGSRDQAFRPTTPGRWGSVVKRCCVGLYESCMCKT
jgi:hypothetical protein